jgi:hypothetical protein
MNIFEEAAGNIGHKHRSANACAMNVYEYPREKTIKLLISGACVKD